MIARVADSLQTVYMPEFHLFCDANGRCVLKQEEEKSTRDFSDILQALTFIRATVPSSEYRLTVYDAMGKIAYTDQP